MDESIAKLRLDYRQASLTEKDVPPNPLVLFKTWFAEAKSANLCEPNAMVLSTVDTHNFPHSRIVLLKYITDQNELVFFTNYESHKSQHINKNAHVSVLFPWIDLERQVRIQGTLTKISTADSAHYFSGRPRSSQLGAWASQQSSVVPNREFLEANYTALEEKFANNEIIPMPEFWGGWALQITEIEFWQGRTSRLHDRLLYKKNVIKNFAAKAAENDWTISRLAP